MALCGVRVPPAAFPFTAEDLRMPLRLYELRKVHAGDDELQALLDGVFDAILAEVGEP